MLETLVAGMAIFLIGANLGIIYRFWPEAWLVTKMAATAALLAYIAISAVFGHPEEWRLILGVAALLIDTVALLSVYYAMDKTMRGDGVLVAYRRR